MGYFDFDPGAVKPVFDLAASSAWKTWIPSWAQAGASIAAVLAALYLAGHQNRIAGEVREKERRARAQVLAAEIFGAVADVADNVDRLQRFFPANPQDFTPPSNYQNPGDWFRSNISTQLMVIPEPILRNADKLYLLGPDEGTNLAQLMVAIENWQTALQTAAYPTVMHGPAIEPVAYKDVQDALALLAATSRDGLADLLRIIGSRDKKSGMYIASPGPTKRDTDQNLVVAVEEGTQ